MSGQRIRIGSRDTYFPPFINERFDGPPYWACTFTALLNGANVGFLGKKPASHGEVRALARSSGDADLRGGSKSRHMIRAMKARYNKPMGLEALPPRRVQERLGSGWALVAAVTYGQLPVHYRRWSPRFTKGHRITLIGWDGRHTWILDPMATKGHGYAGEKILWSDLEPAWWSGEQLWFAEGMFRSGPKVEILEDLPDGQWRIPAGNRLIARDGKKPQMIMRKVVLSEQKSGRFDALVQLVPGKGKPTGPFLRVSSGGLKGMLIPANTRNMHIKPKRTPVPGGPAAKAQPKPSPTRDPSFIDGRTFEYNRIKNELGPVVNLPDPPK
jgi:hypothetical protein